LQHAATRPAFDQLQQLEAAAGDFGDGHFREPAHYSQRRTAAL
jgi:hypothetical protein